MAVTTVAQFAAELSKPAGTLLEQLQAAGVKKSSVDDSLSETDKERLPTVGDRWIVIVDSDRASGNQTAATRAAVSDS